MKLIIVGGFSEIFELCEDCGFNIRGYLDQSMLMDCKYTCLGDDNFINEPTLNDLDFGLVLSPDLPSKRKQLATLYLSRLNNFPSIISPGAKISKSAQIGQGSIIQWGAYVSSNVLIGSFVKLNVYSNVMHDVSVGDYTTIAPNAAIMGRVNIGKGCYIGANSTIKQDVTICDDVVIGAGAVVTKDISIPGTYLGVPADKKNEK